MSGRGASLAGWEGSSDRRDGTKWWVGLIGRVGDGVWGRRGVGRLRLLRRFSRFRLEVVCFPFS